MTADQNLATDDTHLTAEKEIIDAVVGETEEQQDDKIMMKMKMALIHRRR